MAGAVMMYVVPMMLGMTYDIRKDKPGVPIFNDTTDANSLKIEHFLTDSQYRMMDSTDNVKDFLSVDGRLSLRMKAGLVNVNGYGSYLKDKSSHSNSLEIVIKVYFETVTRTIPSWWLPNKDWTQKSSDVLGTHYCRSITYGGTLIASVQIYAKNEQDKERIKGAIQAGINAKSLQGEIQGKLEMLRDELRDDTSTELNYYATVPIPGVSYNIEDLIKLVEAFPEHVKKVNGGLGVPQRMELVPLSALSSLSKTHEIDRGLSEYLNDMEDEFDDIRMARSEFVEWTKSLPPVLDKKIKTKLETFQLKLNNLYTVYVKAISDIDATVGASKQPFADASEAYRDGEYILPGKYMRKFQRLQNEIFEDAPELAPKYGGATFIRWGAESCSQNPDDVETALIGVAITSSVNQHGGSAEFTCSPTNPSFKNPTELFDNYQSDAQTALYISPLRYRGGLDKYVNMQNSMLSCSMCRAARRTSVLVLSAFTKCPNGWTDEYSGLLMAPRGTSFKGQYICVDSDMKDPGTEVSFGSNNDDDDAEIQEVTAGCGILPCEPYKENTPLSCIVCTR